MKSRNPFIAFLFVLLLFWATFTYDKDALGQGGHTNDIVLKGGSGIAGVNVAICQPLATTAASVTANIATFTMSSNPQTAGYVAGMQILVSGFTGGDTFFNAGSIVNNQISGGFTILSVTPTQILVTLVHANAAAGTNGTILQQGNSVTPCAGLASLFTDFTLTTPSANPLISDGLGNYNYTAAPGQYFFQYYGPTVTLVIKPVTVPCVINAASCLSGTVIIANTQVGFGSGVNSIAGSNNLTWNNATSLLSIQNSSGNSALSLYNSALATSITNQDSPFLNLLGASWNGATSVTDGFNCFADPTLVGTGIILHCVHTGGYAGEHLSTILPAVLNLGAPGQVDNSAVVFFGSASGSYTLGVAPNAGSAHQQDLPAADPLTGQVLVGFNGNPDGSAWETPGIQCGTMAANAACSNTLTATEHFASGIAILSGGTSTFTGLSPAFTSTTSYFCVGNDITTPANTVTVIPASASTVTVTGTGTDHIQFVCAGG